MERTFEDKPAIRKSVPLLIGLTGASGSGKTFSALRLATGIQRVSGGEIFFIDTEANRALHYAPREDEQPGGDKFKFRHIPFGAPFSPLDYLAAIKHCVSSGAGVVVVDSMSHEHEGPGGVLEMHDEIVQKRSGGDWRKAQAVTFACWAEPKAQRRRLINEILQLGVNAVFCFRAKEKIKLPSREEKEGGQKEPIQMGWMPIAGDEFVYEMTANCLLYPGSNGTPTWNPSQPGERQMTKLPAQFASVLTPGTQLTESLGEQMAQWAAGGASPSESLASRIQSAGVDELRSILSELEDAKKSRTITPADYKAHKHAVVSRGKTLKAAQDEPPPDVELPSESDVRDPGEEG